MKRKRITQLFPWLIPLRKKQRIFCFYLKMKFDSEIYSSYQPEDLLQNKVFESSCPMYNYNTGFDFKYQENKVYNLKLASSKIDKLIIKPGETFSFWQCVRYASKNTPYKKALAEVNGQLTTVQGGGLCQISNLLNWMFLHSPLTLVERNGHKKKDFPEPLSDAPMGVDATVCEGWLDLKFKNNTNTTFQLSITFDDEHIIGKLLAEHNLYLIWQVENQNLKYISENDKIFEEVDIVQSVYDVKNIECLSSKTVYKNRCEIGYKLPEGTKIYERGNTK